MRKNKSIAKASFYLLSLIVLVACNNKEESSDSLLENYFINAKGLYPESVDFDTKNNHFIISSFNKGAVYTMNADGKNLTSFITDSNLIAALGVFTDEANDRIIVVSGDAGVSEKSAPNGSSAGSKAYLGVYNSKTGTLIKGIDLKALNSSGPVFPNDIAVDEDSNIYITDSFSPNIYKVDKNYNKSIFISDNLFSAPSGTFGLNGIVYKDGYLIVAHTQASKLFKIKMSDNSISDVSGIDSSTIAAPDGLEWKGDQLIIVENGLGNGKVHVYYSANNWAAASKVSEFPIGKSEFPTAAVTARNGKVYILQSYLGKLLSGDKSQENYKIQGLKF